MEHPHVFAHTAPETLTAMDCASIRTFLNTFGSHLPCAKCRRRFREFMEQHASTDAAFATRKQVINAHERRAQRGEPAQWQTRVHTG